MRINQVHLPSENGRLHQCSSLVSNLLLRVNCATEADKVLWLIDLSLVYLGIFIHHVAQQYHDRYHREKLRRAART